MIRKKYYIPDNRTLEKSTFQLSDQVKNYLNFKIFALQTFVDARGVHSLLVGKRACNTIISIWIIMQRVVTSDILLCVIIHSNLPPVKKLALLTTWSICFSCTVFIYQQLNITLLNSTLKRAEQNPDILSHQERSKMKYWPALWAGLGDWTEWLD